ncbi:MAG: hypothetical protein ACT4QD_07115 [Acidobacteriota bacterium]
MPNPTHSSSAGFNGRAWRRPARNVPIVAALLALSVAGAGLCAWPIADAQPGAGALRIVVLAGEDSVNIIQQKTAVAPLVEVRDRNDLPVAGALVTFAIDGGKAAAFAGGAPTITVSTNAAGQAVAAGLRPLVSGVVQINVQAEFQGLVAKAAIAQTNVMTTAQAAALGATAGQGSGTSTGATAAGGGAGGGGGGLSATTIGLVGGAIGGGVLAATQAAGAEDTATSTTGNTPQPTRYSGPLSGSEDLVFGGVFCRTEAMTGTLNMDLRSHADGTVSGDATIMDGTIVRTAVSPGCAVFFPVGSTDRFGMQSTPVTGTAGNLAFMRAQTNQVPPGPADPQGNTNTHEYTFTGALNANVISGSVFHRRIVGGVVAGTHTFAVTLR